MVIRGTAKIPVGGTGSTEEALDDLAKMLRELVGQKGTLEEAKKECRQALGIARKEIEDEFGVKFGWLSGYKII